MYQGRRISRSSARLRREAGAQRRLPTALKMSLLLLHRPFPGPSYRTGFQVLNAVSPESTLRRPAQSRPRQHSLRCCAHPGRSAALARCSWKSVLVGFPAGMRHLPGRQNDFLLSGREPAAELGDAGQVRCTNTRRCSARAALGHRCARGRWSKEETAEANLPANPDDLRCKGRTSPSNCPGD